MLRTTRLRLFFTVVLAALVMAVPARSAVMANKPSPITQLVSATDSYTSQQREQIRAWAEWWSRELSADEPERISEGRRRLLEPLRAGNVRPLFRETYSDILLEHIEAILNDDAELFVAVNALQVAAVLGTESAARLMTRVADPLEEPREQIRLWAVHGIRTIFSQGTLDEGRYPGVLRDLSRAGLRESNWMVLQRHFDALRAAGTENARERQVELLSAILDRLQEHEDGPHDTIRAAHYAIVIYRDQFANLRRAEQLSFGTAAAPVIGRIFEIASQHWDETAEADESSLAATYGGVVQISEEMLGIIDDLVRSQNTAPRTNMGEAWAQRDRQRFQQDAAQWADVLRQPPYSGLR